MDANFRWHDGKGEVRPACDEPISAGAESLARRFALTHLKEEVR